MKVSALIEQLKEFDGEEELIVAYWSKETVEGYGSPKLTDEQWYEVVDTYDDGEWHWQSSAAEDFVEIAENVVKGSEG